MLSYIKFFQLMVVSLLLTTFYNCNSTKKAKFKSEETIAVKKDSTSSINTNTSINTTVLNTTTKTVDSYNKDNDLSIEYNPLFDTLGNLIPFTYNKEVNGQKTSINITGNAKVIDNTKEKVIKENTVTKEEYIKTIDSLSNKIDKLEYSLNQVKKLDTKKTDKATDYIKYIIWLGIAISFLTAIIIALFIYFKTTIGKYKKLLPL